MHFPVQEDAVHIDAAGYPRGREGVYAADELPVHRDGDGASFQVKDFDGYVPGNRRIEMKPAMVDTGKRKGSAGEF